MISYDWKDLSARRFFRRAMSPLAGCSNSDTWDVSRSPLVTALGDRQAKTQGPSFRLHFTTALTHEHLLSSWQASTGSKRAIPLEVPPASFPASTHRSSAPACHRARVMRKRARQLQIWSQPLAARDGRACRASIPEGQLLATRPKWFGLLPARR